MGAYTAIGIGGHQAHIEKLAEPLYQRPNKRTVSVNYSNYYLNSEMPLDFQIRLCKQ